MGIIDKIKGVFKGMDANSLEFEQVIKDTVKELKSENRDNYYWYTITVNKTKVYQSVKQWEDKKKVDFIEYLTKRIHNSHENQTSWDWTDQVPTLYVSQLCKDKLHLETADLVRIHTVFLNNKMLFRGDYSEILEWPIGSIITNLEIFYRKEKLSDEFKEALIHLKKDVSVADSRDEKSKTKILERIDTIVFRADNESGEVKPTHFMGEDPFTSFANEIIESQKLTERQIWYQLLVLAKKATGSSPSKKFLDDSKSLIKELGADIFKKTTHSWFNFIIDLKERETRNIYGYITHEFLSTINTEPIKGFVWMCAHFHDTNTIHTIAKLAERCYKKIPNVGAPATGIGNACLFVLYRSKGLDGIGQLSRLKLRLKLNSTQKLIDKYLEKSALENGVSIHEIEDLAVNDFGLVDGKKQVLFDDITAELSIIGVGKTEIKWIKEDGSLQKSVPAFIKEKYAPKLKKLKDSAKNIEKTVSAQRDRIDRMFRSDRKMNWDHFEKRYLNHGLMGYLTKNIIWNFEKDNKIVSAIYIDSQWIKNDNDVFVPTQKETITLWHPASSTVENIKKWREFFMERKILQPLKQAFREVYLLTDAEIRTRSYSNRMAAHILKQHQFNSLANIRGWKNTLLGNFDNGMDGGICNITLPDYGFTAQYWVNEVMQDNDTAIWSYVATDQIRFINTSTNEAIDLVDIPAIPFSEIFRDIDLFVGVASVGNDPQWRDSGGIAAHRDYWQSYSFGDLSEIAKMRKDILTGLIPRLKISKVSEIKDKFLVVKGKLRTYKIHIGSTNILMEPNDQYLCIVPDRSQKSHTENVFLPFEGDAGLSVILSKAFLLADDDKITDTTITSQIKRE